MDSVVLIIFVCVLMVSVLAHIPILYPLILGYLLFAAYSLKKGFSLKGILRMSADGIASAKNILITFMLIGVITALWRAGGTIPAIVCYSSRIINPEFFVLAAFLLNCMVSTLTGTAFGTSATMGSICMAIAHTLNVDPVMTGGAVLAGAYFGDRCSPVSTSAFLVAAITGTDIYKNIRNMIKTAAVPFALSCLIYLIYGILTPVSNSGAVDVYGMFSSEFKISVIALIPAAALLALSFLRVNVKGTMAVSIGLSMLVCLFLQKIPVWDVLRISVLGFSATREELAPMINGGGIVSMLRVAAIVCISSCYAGIFHNTGLLDPVKKIIDRAGKRLRSYGVILLTSIAGNMVACNQTLAIMLTHQLCGHIEGSKEREALYLENSAVIIAPLVPWSIAGSVSLVSAGAPALSVATSFFLFLLPVCAYIFDGIGARAEHKNKA